MSKLKTILGRKTDSNRCYRNTEYYYVVFAVIIFILPFVNYYQLVYNGEYNLINFQKYYSDESIIFNDEMLNKEYNSSHYVLVDNYYITTLYKNQQNIYKSIVLQSGSDIYFRNNYSSDLIFIKSYSVDNRPINTIEQLIPKQIPRLPLQLFTVAQTVNNTDPLISHGRSYYPRSDTSETIIPSEWINFWNNITIIFYCVDSNNKGIAYNYNNKETNLTSNLIEENLNIGISNLSVKIVNLNISGQFDPTINKYVYHSLPITEQTSNLLSNFYTDNNSIVSMLMDTIIASDPLYENGFSKDSQIRGYRSIKNIIGNSQFIPSKVGWYIKMDKEFNLTEYLYSGYSSNYFINLFHLVNNPPYSTLTNGFRFRDNGLFLGKTVTIDETINTVIITDVFILSSAIVILVTLYTFPTKSRKEFKNKFKIECFIQEKTLM